MSDWCILCTAPSRTLMLSASLAEAGFCVWAPAGPVVVREAMFRTRREIPTALVPGVVFAKVAHLSDLLALSHSPSLLYQVWDSEQCRMVTKGHPFFRVFRGGDHRPIPDGELAWLRKAEHRPAPKREQRTFVPGDRVRSSDGSFSGVTGTVVSVKGKMVRVAFPNWPLVPEFASWLLHPAIDEAPVVHVSNSQGEQALSAKAA